MDWSFITEQVPLVMVLLVILGTLYKYILKKDSIIAKKDKIIQDKDEALIDITRDVLKVMTLLDLKTTQNTKEHEALIAGVDELKDLAKKLRYECSKK